MTATLGPSSGAAVRRWRVLERTALPVAAALALFAALLVARARHLIDDSFIVFRYARSWAETGVPRFNPGVEPPVEGYSDFLWMALLAVARALGLPLPTTALVLGALAGAGTVALTAVLLRREVGARGATLFVGLALTATAPALVVGSSGGLETSLFALLVLATFVVLTGEGAERRRGFVGGLAALGVALVRVEGFLWVMVVLSAAALARGPEGARARRVPLAFGVYLAGFVAFLLWRHGVHGDWLSNTAAAKAGLGLERAARGARYVASWGLATAVPIAALALAPLALRRRPRIAAAAFLALAFALYAVLVGGDWMPFWRFLAPAAPFVAVTLCAGLARLPRGAALGLGAALVALQALPLFGVSLAPRGVLESLRFRGFRGEWRSEWDRLEVARANGAHFEALGRALDEGLGEGEGLVFGAIGAIGWYAPRLFLHDRNGLVDREVARLDARVLAGLEAGAATAGHDRRVPRAWFLSRQEPAQPTIFHATLVEAAIAGPESPLFATAVAAAMRGQVLSQPGEEALLDATVVEARPVSGGRTLLLWRRAPDTGTARRFWGQLGITAADAKAGSSAR